MKKLLFFLGIVFFLMEYAEGQKVKLKTNTDVTGICYAGKKEKKIYIPPPDEFFKKGETKGASITAYYTGFTAQSKSAVDYAISILKSLLPADTKMTLKVSYEKLGEGVLGSSVITGYAAGWGIDARNPMAFYPVSLAEKIAGESLNTDAEGDLELRINNSVAWYLGTDGNVPVGKYDLITVALHEICHGLGFFDSMNAENGIGSYGLGSVPMIYETYLENETGKKLTDTLEYQNNSAKLATELTGGHVYFNGPLIRNYSGSRIKLYAPGTWDSGSSISHLDEDTYPDGSKALMTPFIDLREAIHDPGKFNLSILGDMGWINTRIIHKPSGDTEENLTQMMLSAEIRSDTLYNKDKVGLVFSFNNFKTSDTIYLVQEPQTNLFKAPVSIPAYNSDLQYYFFTEDCFKRIYKSPSLNEFMRYESFIGRDTVKPIVSHTPLKYCLQTLDTLSFTALADDNIGVDSVYIEYRIGSGSQKYLGMKKNGSYDYKASISARLMNLAGADSVRYRIFAVDSAKIPNISVSPESGFYAFPVEKISSVTDRYISDFSNAGPDFFNIGFTISKPDNFTEYGLHTKHPYESPETDNGSIEYTAMLRHPVKFEESGLFINYNEVVLVEPGEPGSVFGSQDFYDYVIMEASKDFGKTWNPLEPGYDSRYYTDWAKNYNDYVSSQTMNSTYVGTESMLRKHTIYYRPSATITAGDTLLLRFRLFSDPYANGWGWVIQDLKLNALINDVEKTGDEDLLAFPNPGNGIINFSGKDVMNTSQFRYSVYNASGICLVSKKLSESSGTINISTLPSGIYIIVINKNNRLLTFRYSLVKP